MSKINFVDPDNSDEYEEEIPEVLREMIDLKEERKAKLIVDEMIVINLGDEKDPKLV